MNFDDSKRLSESFDKVTLISQEILLKTSEIDKKVDKIEKKIEDIETKMNENSQEIVGVEKDIQYIQAEFIAHRKKQSEDFQKVWEYSRSCPAELEKKLSEAKHGLYETIEEHKKESKAEKEEIIKVAIDKVKLWFYAAVFGSFTLPIAMYFIMKAIGGGK